MRKREDVWWLLSDLFVDTTRTEDDLLRLGKSLAKFGFSIIELEQILKKEVAPVAGRWMNYPTVGPWPCFDREDLERGIQENLRRPWYAKRRWGLFNPSWLVREWSVVKRGLASAQPES